MVERESLLLSIGRFSFLTGLTHRALRLYDELGLLPPADVDADSGYRRYAVVQLATAQRIKRLREIGLPLEEIREVMADPDRLGPILERQRLRLGEQAARTREALSLLEQLSKEVEVSMNIEFRDVPSELAAVIEMTTSLERIGDDVKGAYDELYATIAEEEVSPSGPCFCAYPDPGGDVMRAIAGVPVAAKFDERGRVRIDQLPATRAAFGTYVGSYDGLTDAWQEMFRFVDAQGKRNAQTPREVYRISWGEVADPAAFETDIIVPVA